jgi:hypothetical protein
MRVVLMPYGCALLALSACSGGTPSQSTAAGATAEQSASRASPSGVGAPGSSSSGAAASDAPAFPDSAIVVPDDPGAADLHFEIDTRARHAISPFIYGLNAWNGSEPANLRLSRLGGNRLTAYNWETNASNAGTDYQNENDDHLCANCTGCSADCRSKPGEAARATVATARDHGAAALVTVPILGQVAADMNGPVSPAADPSYLQSRFLPSQPRKGGPFSTAPDLTDGVVFQDEFVSFLKQAFPPDEQRPIFFSLDNEPCLWSSTHPLLRCPGGACSSNPTTYDELVQRNIDYAAAIKDVVPAAKVFGPVLYGWSAYESLQGAPDAPAKGNFLDYYLRAMAAADQAGGRRLVDVLDLHWYTEVPDVPASRAQAPRSLWDPSYTENSWIAGILGEPIRLIPRIKEKIAAYYPGTELAFTEYNYGEPNDIHGALAQADALGVFGREGVFAASLWPLVQSSPFLYAAFDMFRNYDGAGGVFGDLSVRAETSSLEASSVYASLDAGHPERLVIVAINKSDTSRSAAVRLVHDKRFRRAEVYALTAAAPEPSPMGELALKRQNAFTVTLPAASVTTLVLQP